MMIGTSYMPERKDMNDMSLVAMKICDDGIVAFADSKASRKDNNDTLFEDIDRGKICLLYTSIELKHFSFGSIPVVLVVSYHRYICKDCSSYFSENIPFQFDNRKATVPNVQSALFEMKENYSMASISRMHDLGKNTIYRIFNENIHIPDRFYHLSSVISIDQFLSLIHISPCKLLSLVF